jgi:hypothetical protein
MLMSCEQHWYNALDNNRTVNTVEDMQLICMPRHHRQSQSLMHVPCYADGEQVLQCIFIKDETRFNLATSKIKKVSMMWRQPSSPPAKNLEQHN